MPTKPSDLLNRIPSVSELLEKPQVRALADRWSRSTVAAGLRSFLDELRSDLQRRATNAGMPTARELAERAARYVIAMQEGLERPAINATGRIYGAPFTAGPIADAALERMVAFGREYVIAPATPKDEDSSALSSDAMPMLCRLTGAQAATAVHSYGGAVWLTLASVADRREAVVARSQMGDVEPGCGLSALAASTGVTLQEIGTTNRACIGDYEAALTSGTGAILRISSDAYSIVGESESVGLESLAALARDREVPLIDAMGGAALVDLPFLGEAGPISVRASLIGGADLVVARGEGLIAGPKCGLVLGRSDRIRRITSHPLFAALQLDSLRSAALAATLDVFEANSDGEPALPLVRLLAAPVENLRNRAERIATQVAHAPGIASAEAVPTRSSLFSAQTGGAVASYAVALTPADGYAASSLERRYASAPQAVVGRVEGNRLMLDIRTVLPRQDQALVDAITGKTVSNPG